MTADRRPETALRPISIHIPRVGDDSHYMDRQLTHVIISIHIPRVGDDYVAKSEFGEYQISIHIPRVGDDKPRPSAAAQWPISIHIPRVGDDNGGRNGQKRTGNFNPHPPRGG